jgi:probable F420-dependent oxidoreductase
MTWHDVGMGGAAHPFRFSVTPPGSLAPMSAWVADLRRIEDLGFDTVVVADHFTGGWDVEPMVVLTAAAMATTTLRLQTGVLGNDYRHPVQVHRMAATLDAVSEGRFTLGIGAGWMVSDYEAAGLAYDPPGTRVDRLVESLAVIKGLFGPHPFDFAGAYYTVRGLVGSPPPVQRPHPPLFVGGGSPRVLRLAGGEADIVGVNASLRAGEMGAHAIVDLRRPRVEEKVGWVHQGAAAAGRSPDDIELEMNHWLVRVTKTESEADELLARVAARYEVDPTVLTESPSVLVGPVARCIETLQERREQLGFSNLQLDAGFPPKDLDSLAPIVAALAGT